MKLKFIGSLLIVLLVTGLIVGTVYALNATATQSFAGLVEIDGGLVSTPVTFTDPTDFPAGMSITDVDITIDWTKTDGTCAAQAGSQAFHDETRFDLRSPLGTTITLVPFIHYGGQVDIGDVITTFDDAAGGPPAGGTPVTGVFQPVGAPLSTFTGEDPLGTWNLDSRDQFTDDPLCLNSYDLTIAATSKNLMCHFDNGKFTRNGKQLRAPSWSVIAIPDSAVPAHLGTGGEDAHHGNSNGDEVVDGTPTEPECLTRDASRHFPH